LEIKEYKMKKSETLIGIKIKELTQNGFVTVTKIFLDREIDNIEEKKTAINEMTETLYNSKSFFIVNTDKEDKEMLSGCVIKGIENKTFKIEMILK
jgi:phosphoribosylaminoimidazole (AIR) synthetase